VLYTCVATDALLSSFILMFKKNLYHCGQMRIEFFRNKTVLPIAKNDICE
jgi:hypothetical protein